jgi:hypothetical protein
VTAFQVNPFVKFGGLELFGVLERAEGKASAEAANRAIRQYALDTIYRVGPNEELFIAARGATDRDAEAGTRAPLAPGSPCARSRRGCDQWQFPASPTQHTSPGKA